MAKALHSGALNASDGQVDVTLASPFDCDAEHVLNADALILFTTENFGYMSGALKDFFDRVYEPCLAQQTRNQAKPYALLIKAGLDGTGTEIAVKKITKGLAWKEAQPTLLCKGEYKTEFNEHCYQLGQTMAASLNAGIL